MCVCACVRISLCIYTAVFMMYTYIYIYIHMCLRVCVCAYADLLMESIRFCCSKNASCVMSVSHTFHLKSICSRLKSGVLPSSALWTWMSFMTRLTLMTGPWWRISRIECPKGRGVDEDIVVVRGSYVASLTFVSYLSFAYHQHEEAVPCES